MDAPAEWHCFGPLRCAAGTMACCRSARSDLADRNLCYRLWRALADPGLPMEKSGNCIMPTTQSEPVVPTIMITTEAHSRRFGRPCASVDRLTCTVRTGEVFGLLVPNGAGKSTVIKMLTTLLPPTSGTAHVAGFDLVHQTAQVRRVIGYVPQLLSADGALTGYENLLVFARLYELPRQERDARIHQALTFMNLDEVADRLVGPTLEA
jgi:ABC-type uncharacterized transport system ATPase subunit